MQDSKRDRYKEQTCRQSRGRRECDQLRESSIDTYTLLFVNEIANGDLLYNTGSSTWCSVTSQRGGIGWGVGGRIQRLIQTVAWQKSTQHCYTVTLQLQHFFFKVQILVQLQSILEINCRHVFVFFLFIFACTGSLLLPRVSLVVVSGGYAVVVLYRLFIAVLPLLQSVGSVAMARGLSCSAACRLFLDQGVNSCPARWQVDS